MKKFLISIFVLFAFFGIIGTAGAETIDCNNENYQCISCTYQFHHYTLTFYAAGDGQGGGRVALDSVKENYWQDTYSLINRATIEDFKNEDGDALVCPSSAYVSNRGDGTLTYDVYGSEASTVGLTSSSIERESQSSNGADFLDPSVGEVVASMEVTLRNGDDSTRPPIMGDDGSILTATLTAYSNGEIRATMPRGYEAIISDAITPGMIENDSNRIVAECAVGISCRFIFDESIPEDSDDDDDNPATNPDELCDGNDCDISMRSICIDSNVSSTLRGIGILITLIKILVPAVIIIIGIKNLFQIIVSGKDDDLKKHVKSLVLRIVVGVIIFLIPGIINFIYDAAQDVIGGGQSSDFDNCWNCLFDIDQCDTSGPSD